MSEIKKTSTIGTYFVTIDDIKRIEKILKDNKIPDEIFHSDKISFSISFEDAEYEMNSIDEVYNYAGIPKEVDNLNMEYIIYNKPYRT